MVLVKSSWVGGQAKQEESGYHDKAVRGLQGGNSGRRMRRGKAVLYAE